MVIGVIVVVTASLWGFALRTILSHEHRITVLEQKVIQIQNTAGR